MLLRCIFVALGFGSVFGLGGKVVRCLYSGFSMPTQRSVNVRVADCTDCTMSSVRTLEELVFSLSLLRLFVHNTGPQCCVEIGEERMDLAVSTRYVHLQA